MRIRICANGTPSYVDGKAQRLSNPCRRPPLSGHIHCDECRREAGGYDMRRLHVSNRASGNTVLT